MDGDICALPELIAVARRHGAMVMIDEAHSFAMLGERGLGVREHFGLDPDAVDFWMGTLSKALASHGGFITGRRDFIQEHTEEQLRHTVDALATLQDEVTAILGANGRG